MAQEYSSSLAFAATTASTLPSKGDGDMSLNVESEISQLKLSFTMLRGMIKEQAEHFNAKLEKELGKRAPATPTSATSPQGDVGDVVRAMRRELQTQRELLVKTSQQLPAIREDVANIRRDIDGYASGGASSATNPGRGGGAGGFVSLARHEATVAAIQAEIRALHKATELASIKAGFLAVAASECTGEEKAKLFDTLKERERQLVQETFARPASREGSNLSRPSDLPLLQLPSGSSNEIVVDVDRCLGEELGITFSSEQMQVAAISTGLVKAWNAKNPEQQVLTGEHRLVSVNGVAGDAGRMRRLLREEQPLRLVFVPALAAGR